MSDVEVFADDSEELRDELGPSSVNVCVNTLYELTQGSARTDAARAFVCFVTGIALDKFLYR